MSYAKFVEVSSARNPCLLALRAFLSRPTANITQRERIVSLDFSSSSESPVQREIIPSALALELQETLFPGEKNVTQKTPGQILIIENISKESINELGATLNINPIFFASHIHSVWREVESQSPKFCELPSQTRQRNFSTFSYHQSLLFPDIDERDYRLLCQTNVPRKVAILSGVKGRRFGLAQRCCSVLTVPRNTGWLGLILADPPIHDSFISIRSHENVPITTSSVPLFGGIEDFSSAKLTTNRHYIPKASQSMFEKLLDCWKAGLPDGFSPDVLKLGALAYYPLRIIAGEWVNYHGLMSLSLQQYDRPPSVNETSAQELSRISLALACGLFYNEPTQVY
ncbi:hypothetical protein NPX13_g8278 [Xylaria arbuscula]|uniref:Uncharacterized protein n=1 Tax=Xylaria arbuscula TaxID=114810 RepID=A0A9W8N8Q5_9PEZI|nr:hypothetical protein NPX13_g8278 [Xylaria arbuscula]